MIVHELNFISPALGIIEIEEPTGFRGVDFGIKQDSDRLGRDVSYAGSTNKLTLNKLPNHHLEKILYAKDKFGYEAIVQYQINFDGEVEIVGQIDIFNSETDRNNYFTFTVLEIGELAILKRRMETKVDLLSNMDIDLNEIEPCAVNNTILPAFPYIKFSRWEAEIVDRTFSSLSGANMVFIAPYPRSVQYDIEDSTSPFYAYSEAMPISDGNLEQARDETTIIRAATNLENVKITLKDLNLNIDNTGFPVDTRIILGWGNSYVTGQHETHIFYAHEGDNVNLVNQTYEYTIPFLNETDFIYVYIRITQGNIGQTSSTLIDYSGGEMVIEATSVSYTTVTRTIRLIDAIKQVVKSISGLNVVAPKWEFGGKYYNQFITNTNSMRLITDKPFTVSMKDIVNQYFPEPFADFQIRKNGDVFIGDYYDYYANQEIGNFTVGESKRIGQLTGFKETGNPRYALNRFTIGYDKFQSLKENPAQNTNFEVHGNLEANIPNKNVNNSKEVKIGWVRSPYSIEDSRRKSIDLTQDIATQDDDNIILIDAIINDEIRRFKRTTFLRHRYVITSPQNLLTLTNDESFSWLIMGIVPGNGFQINLIDGTVQAGYGDYIVASVSSKDLVLYWIAGIVPISRDGVNTTFTYGIYPQTANYIARTDEGFSEIEGIPNTDRTINLMFTTKRNMLNYDGILCGSNMYTENKPITITEYKNNPEGATRLVSETALLVEGGNYITDIDRAIVTPVIYNIPIEMSLRRYFELEDDIRFKNGYIRFFNGNNIPIKGFIQEAVFKIKSDGRTLDDYMGMLEAKIEEKYQPDYINIVDVGNGTITINGEITPDAFHFETDGYGNLSIFDANGKLLYVPVPYNKVKVNYGDYAETPTQLRMWLKQIQNQG